MNDFNEGNMLDAAALKKKYPAMADYHIDFAIHAEKSVGLEGRRVLEVGGCLPRNFVIDELKAKQWICIEELSYYKEINMPLPAGVVGELSSVANASQLPEYGVFSGRAEFIPSSIYDSFDVIVSVACFEHINALPLSLQKMHSCLKPGGKLFSMFSPIWATHNGHHLHRVTDKTGRVFSFDDPTIPPWGHLLMSSQQMYTFLLNHTDPEAASEIVYNIYHSPCINRLFTEDYAEMVEASPFKNKTVIKYGITPAPDDIYSMLITRHPGKINFDSHGLMLILGK